MSKIDNIGSLGSYKCVVLHRRERVFLSKSIVLPTRDRLFSRHFGSWGPDGAHMAPRAPHEPPRNNFLTILRRFKPVFCCFVIDD